MNTIKAMALALSALSMTLASAGTTALVVPDSAESSNGNGVFFGPLTSSPRTYQLLVHEDQLVDVLGKTITGVSWRLPASATAGWPDAAITYPSYDIYLSEGVAPADRSLVFADNAIGEQTQVRTGPLTIAAGAYSSGLALNDFGPVVAVDDWRYEGGHLLVELRHAGSEGSSRTVDSLTTSAADYGDQFSAAWANHPEATDGQQGNFTVVRFTVEDDGTVPLIYTVTPSAGAGGSLDPDLPQAVEEGDTISFEAVADAGFVIDTVSGCNGTLAGTTYTTGPVIADCAVEASFTEKPAGTWTVTPDAGPGGNLDPGTPQIVDDGDSASFEVIPNPGFLIDDVSGCNGTLAGTIYITAAIIADCTVTARFAIDTDLIFVDGFEQPDP